MAILLKLVIWIIPIVFAITVHEVAHGWVANRLGDATAKLQGRLTLNPLKHIDWLGTIIVPGILFLLGGFLFGWAKPVPVIWTNLKHPKRDMALVAAAGPCANLVMILAWGLIIHLALLLKSYSTIAAYILIYMGEIGISINLMLAILNLIPIPPLDGSRVVTNFLPPQLAFYYNRLEVFGLVILLLLITTGWLGHVLVPLLIKLQVGIHSLLGLSSIINSP